MRPSDKFWDSKAKKYANSPIADVDSYKRKLSETRAYLNPNMKLLEVGCGTGTTAVYHAPYVDHIDAIDISENMLSIARSRAVESKVENITFTQSDLTEFNAVNASMDAVLALSVIHLLPDRHAFFLEVARALKPGGIFVSSTGCLGSSALRFIKLAQPLGKLLGAMPDIFIIKESELVNEIIDAGFLIETKWCHGRDGICVFIIARKK